MRRIEGPWYLVVLVNVQGVVVPYNVYVGGCHIAACKCWEGLARWVVHGPVEVVSARMVVA